MTYINKSSGNPQELTENELLNKYNNEELLWLIPVFIYLCLISISGLIGNGLVCYIYNPRRILTSPKWFVFFLGALDMFSCAVIVPLEIGTVIYPLDFENVAFCKIASFFNVWSTLAMVWTLAIVSVDRYRKVCKPNQGWQLDLKKARIACLFAVIAGLLMSLPAPFGRDIHQRVHIQYNITVHSCTFEDTGITDYRMWYLVLGMVLFVISLLTICVMYCFVGTTIYKQSRARRKQKTAKANPVVTQERVGTIRLQTNATKPVQFENAKQPEVALLENASPNEIINLNEPCNRVSVSNSGAEAQSDFEKESETSMHTKVGDIKAKEPGDVRIEISSPNESFNSNDTTEQSLNNAAESNHDDGQSNRSPAKLERTKSTKARDNKENRATLSLVLVSVAYLICYFPTITTMLIRSSHDNFEDSLTFSQRSAHMLFLRFHLLNCAINPFIYLVSDAYFKNQSKEILCALIGKCKTGG